MRTPGEQPASDTAWWHSAVFYQVYVRSFADATGDGVGDLDGISSRLGYLELLGVDALWLTPFFTSPMADHGYDVADPRDVDPLFGDLAAFDRLIDEAHEHGLKVTIDLVPNHTSSAHPWFAEALAAGPGSPQRSRYLFRDGSGPGGAEPPNNWTSVFGGPAWTRVPRRPVVPAPVRTRAARPELGATRRCTPTWSTPCGSGWTAASTGSGSTWRTAWRSPPGLPDMDPRLLNADGMTLESDVRDPRFDDDGVHEVHRLIRRVLDEYPGTMAVGEIWVHDDDRFARYLRPDELHLGFNFRLVDAAFDADAVRTAIDHSLAAVARVGAASRPGRCPTTTWSGTSPATAAASIGTRRARAMALVELALPGVVYLYNGEELGLPNLELPDWALQDPVWERSGHEERGRDGCRVPMPWEGTSAPFGFSEGAPSWLPMPEEWARLTVEAQLEDEGSMLSLYRQALEVRRSSGVFTGDRAGVVRRAAEVLRVPPQGRRPDLRAQHVGGVRADPAGIGAAGQRTAGRAPAAAGHVGLAGLAGVAAARVVGVVRELLVGDEGDRGREGRRAAQDLTGRLPDLVAPGHRHQRGGGPGLWPRLGGGHRLGEPLPRRVRVALVLRGHVRFNAAEWATDPSRLGT